MLSVGGDFMWKEEYKELMFSKDEKKIDTLEGFKLKFAKLSTPLYKYSKIDKFSLANLENDTVWLSKATNFNDPYDSALTIGTKDDHDRENKRALYERFAELFDFKREEVEQLMDGYPLKEGLNRLLEQYPPFKNKPEMIPLVVEDYIKDSDLLFGKYASGITNLYQERIYASCFSEEPASMLMWSHYADNHQGMVLKYEFINLDLEKHLDVFMGLNPVIYTDDLLNLEKYKVVREKISISTLSAISKSKEWSYEKEWRLIIHEESNERGMVIKVVKPSCIILGAKVNQKHKIMLSLEAKKKGIPIKQIKLENAKYHLSVVDFHEFN